MTQDSPNAQIRIERPSPSYWRVVFDNPPFNIFGPDTTPQLNMVVSAIEADPHVKVVVFESAVPGFFLTHYDFVPPLDATTSMPPGPTGMPPLPDMLVRIGSGETAPLLFTSLGNPNLSFALTQPMGALPTTIYQFALSAFDDWRALAWVGALLIAITVLAANIIGRALARGSHQS